MLCDVRRAYSGRPAARFMFGYYHVISYPDLTAPPGERRSGKLRTLFSAPTTHDVMAISDRMVIVVMATCIVCGVQSNKKLTLHSAGPSNEKDRLQGVCKRLQKPPANS